MTRERGVSLSNHVHTSPAVLCMFVAKAKSVKTFTVALSNYGWSVQLDGERVALFQTQQQALRDVEGRRVELGEKGTRSDVEVIRSEIGESTHTTSPRPFFRRR